MKERMKEIATNNRPKKQNNNFARAQGALWSFGAQGPSDGLRQPWQEQVTICCMFHVVFR